MLFGPTNLFFTLSARDRRRDRQNTKGGPDRDPPRSAAAALLSKNALTCCSGQTWCGTPASTRCLPGRPPTKPHTPRSIAKPVEHCEYPRPSFRSERRKQLHLCPRKRRGRHRVRPSHTTERERRSRYRPKQRSIRRDLLHRGKSEQVTSSERIEFASHARLRPV